MRHFSNKVKKDIRDKVIPVRFTEKEKNFVELVSNKFNISLSEFIRRSALQRRMPAQGVAEINRKTYQELCRIGNNLNQVLKHVKPGMSVLDLGAGSAILSITANKLGAEKVDALEFDSDCESNFNENLQLNNLDAIIPFHNHDVLVWNKFDYDIILANINRNIIEKLIPKFKGTKAKVILSGLFKTDYKTIEQICIKQNFQVKEKMIKGGGLCIVRYSVND